MTTIKVDLDDLRLINGVMISVLGSDANSSFNCSAITRRLFAMVEAGERNCDVLRAAALAKRDNVLGVKDRVKIVV